MTKKKNGCWTMTARPFAACSASVEVTLGQAATAAVVVATFASGGSATCVVEGGAASPSPAAAPQPTASASTHVPETILALIVLSELHREMPPPANAASGGGL